MQLASWDWVIIAAYAAAVITIGLRAGRKQHTSEGYFLAGRRLRWPLIGASIYAANISAEHFVGLAGCGYVTGLAFGCYEWIAVFCLIPLIVLFLPFYMKNRIYTVPEFLERRFGPSVRLAFSAFMVVLSVLAKISISLWAASLVFHELLGWNQMAVIWCVGLVTAVYTMKGGLSAVVFTDAIQTVVLILAAVVMTGIGLYEVGGYGVLRTKLDPLMFSMVKPATDPDLPWPGVFFGVFLVGTFYFSMDQVLVQRVFAAKSLNEGRLGATFCAFLKTLNPIILVGPGLIAAALYPGLANGDLAYPTLLKNLMPTGLLGLTVAGITAALMGHLSATYNSIATLVTRDFYLKLRPQADQDRQIVVGRIAVLAVFILGAVWAPVIGQSKSMFVYLQSVSAYLMMPFAGIFLFAVFWRRTNTPGVLACMGSALVLCPTMMFNNSQHFLPLMNHPLLKPWLHGAMLVTLVCMVVLTAVSLLTAPSPAARLKNTTVASLWGEEAKGMADDPMMAPETSWLKDYRPWLAIVSVGTAVAWYIMR
jgi:solute:Na+ symporter, SSS family